MELKLERRPVGDLVPYEANSKRHGDEDVSAISRSIEQFGFNDPIAVTPDGVIIEGHGRWMAAQRLGLDDVPVLVIEGLEEADYDLYRIAHNKIALTSQFNFPALYEALQDLVGAGDGIVFADMGFSDRVVNDLFAHFGDSEHELAGSPTSATSMDPSRTNTTAISHDVIWDTKENKARFNKFISDEVEKGGDKSMGGEILLAAVKARLPNLWANIVAAIPGEQELDEIAGQTDEEHVNVHS